MGPRSHGSPNFGNWDSREKCHLHVGPVANHKVYYKGEGGGFPPSPGRGESCEFEFARGSS
jgi:hypothetical protein